MTKGRTLTGTMVIFMDGVWDGVVELALNEPSEEDLRLKVDVVCAEPNLINVVLLKDSPHILNAPNV